MATDVNIHIGYRFLAVCPRKPVGCNIVIDTTTNFQVTFYFKKKL